MSLPKITATQLFIDGKFVDSVSGKKLDTFNPATCEKIASVSEAQPEDIDLAVKAARKAFDSGPWRCFSGSQRAKLLLKLCDIIQKNAPELAQLESLDNGMPLSFSTMCSYGSADIFRYYSGFADKIHGQQIPIEGPYLCYTRHEAVGVVAAIIPWNAPLMMLAMKVAPALAMGCTVVLKPAELTPLTALKFGDFMNEAGFPPGVLNIVPGFGATAGKHLVQHPLVDKVAFTGSTTVGFDIMRNSHVSNLKRITLELGGKSPNIILDDADLDLAIAQSQLAVFFNQGQCCVAGSRTFVQEGIYDEFVKRSAEAAKKRKLGCPLAADTEQGPQINEIQFKKILGYIEKGQKEGARLVCGGKRSGDKGYFIEPTVFADVTDDMTIAKEEIFGPVMSIMKFKTVDEVIERGNRSDYGLGAGIVTKDIGKAIKIANALKAGFVYVNCYLVSGFGTPFGGYKNSGVGREMGEYGLRSFTEVKTVIVKVADDALP
jgi:aldehyde dehydrogenase (NAD+)